MSTSPEIRPQSSQRETELNNTERTLTSSHAAYLVGSGLAMGAADIVPGVSGGTMAIATGVYSSLLSAIASINVRSVKALVTLRWGEAFAILHWRFLICLGLGVALGAGLMVYVVRLGQLMVQHPTQVYAVFFGLVLASALVLARRLPWRWPTGTSFFLGVVLGWLVVNFTPVTTPEGPFFLFLSGLIAICAMLLPGISGSFILLILGKYAVVITALHDRDLRVIAPFALGSVVGILLFSRVLKWLLVRWHDIVLSLLIGLLFGSLWRIWPYQNLLKETVGGKERVVEATPYWPAAFSSTVVLLMLAGVLVVVAIEGLAMRRRSSGRVA